MAPPYGKMVVLKEKPLILLGAYWKMLVSAGERSAVQHIVQDAMSTERDEHPPVDTLPLLSPFPTPRARP